MKKLDLEYLIGKSELESRKIAEDNGYAFRITRYDDVNFIITCDFRMDRINVEVENDIITNVYFG